MNKRDINFFNTIEPDERVKDATMNRIFIMLILGALLINIAGISVLQLSVMDKRKDIAEINSFFELETTQIQIAEQEKITQDTATANADIQVIQGLENHIKGLQGFNTDIYNVIQSVKPTNVEVDAFSFISGTVSINCKTPDNNPPADYTKALEATNRFDSVQYRGFVKGDDGVVTFPILCKLKAVI